MTECFFSDVQRDVETTIRSDARLLDEDLRELGPAGPAPEAGPSLVYWVFRNYRGFGRADELGPDFATIRRIAASARLLGPRAARTPSTPLRPPVHAAALALGVPEEERVVLDESMHRLERAGRLLDDLVAVLPQSGGPADPQVLRRLSGDAVRLKQTAKDKVFGLCGSLRSAAYFDAAVEHVAHHIDVVAERLRWAPPAIVVNAPVRRDVKGGGPETSGRGVGVR